MDSAACLLDLAPRNAEECWRGVLFKDSRLVSDVHCYKIPIPLPSQLRIEKIEAAAIYPLMSLRTFELFPLAVNPTRLAEWQRFLTFLKDRSKVASILILGWELLINPPLAHLGMVHPKQSVHVGFRERKMPVPSSIHVHIEPIPAKVCTPSRDNSIGTDHVQASPQQPLSKPNYARTHPGYLETSGQNHASWAFGAVAELIDNARDAKATRIDIFIHQEYLKASDSEIPVLFVRDNGTGMSHLDITRMVSFGHRRPEEEDESLIGRFGVGFKSGVMRLGKDAVVFTQGKETRSIAFFSRSYNRDKEEVELPLITYRKKGGWMAFDLDVHSQDEAEARLCVVKEFSPFNEYSIGSIFSAFGEGTGTTVCVYNLDRWGQDYNLQWDTKVTESGHKLKRDIWIRSRRVRTRPAQMTREIPLDYSLHAYLEVLFLEPKMKLYVQGTLVKTRRLHKSLNKTQVFKGNLLEKNVELTLGRSQAERERGNCGIFLYWHGRLIEAYKRVGGMTHSADVGRGVIGVIDVTDLMKLEDGVAVLNHKQGFQDCKAYNVLEDWLGSMTNEYWDKNYDPFKVDKKDENATYTPDHSWVQCNRCLKWRMLEASADEKELPDEWFCYMPPFKGSCLMSECETEAGIVTVGCVRTSGVAGPVPKEEDDSATACHSSVSNKECSDTSLESDDNARAMITKPLVARRSKRATPSKTRQPPTKKPNTKAG